MMRMRRAALICRSGLRLSRTFTAATATTPTTASLSSNPVLPWRRLPRNITQPRPTSLWRREYSTMKHQEIEGPTVDRDTTPVAEETREVTESLMKTMYETSKVVAVLGLSQLGAGAYLMVYASSPKTMGVVTTVSSVAFAFPFVAALMMRRSLKSMQFFNRMEKAGRLQVLTCSLQIFKQLRLFFLRLRTLSYLSLAGVSFSLTFAFLSPPSLSS